MGPKDSIYHPFDLEGRQHMEYLRFHGEYDDLPLDEMMASYAKHYSPSMYEAPRGDFDRDVEEETRELSVLSVIVAEVDLDRRVVVAEVHHSVRAPRHLLPHETGEALEVHDEAAHGGRRHHSRGPAGSTQARLLLLAPGVDPLEVGRTQHDQQVELGEQRLIVPTELSIHIPAPIPARVLQALEAVDRRLELVGALRTRAHAPALEDDHVATALPWRPLSTGAARPSPCRSGAARAACLHAAQRKDPYPEVHVVRPRHAAGRKQGMNRARTLETLGAGQIEVVERKDRDAQSVDALQEPLQQPSQRRLPSPLRAVEPKHQRRSSTWSATHAAIGT